MSHDVVIRGGYVVDGSGASPARADVAIDSDRITAVGKIDGRGRRELEAAGRLVTPGFVDIHTHFDAQLFWDPTASPSCWHGVTTIATGNCGVTFAPVRPDAHRYLAEMMEAVEDIPADAIMEGLDWSWENYGDYLGALGKQPLGVNVGGMVGHCALRYYAMGERSLGDSPPNDEELSQMAELLGEAMNRGALGFSTSRTFLHTLPDGRPVPGTFATPDELGAMASVLSELGRGVIGAAARIGERDGKERQNSVAELAWMEEISRTSGRPVTFAIMQSDRRPDLWSWVMDEVAAARGRGADLRPQTTARGTGILYGLFCRTPWESQPGWAELASKSLEDQLTALTDASFRDRLIAEADLPDEGSATLLPKDPAKLYLLLPGVARYDVSAENSLEVYAMQRGMSPAAAFLELSLESRGRALLYYPALNQDLDAVSQMLTNPNVLLGVADAGAHVTAIMDAGQSTYFLTQWIREKGLLDIGTAVRKLSAEGAALFDLDGRGTIATGNYADINVIDFDSLELYAPEFAHDFPLGAGRFTQRAKGYDYTLVNGQVVVDHDELTGERPGQTVRPR